MSSKDFILGRAKKDSPECVGAVVGIGENGSFPSGLVILGAAFLKNCEIYHPFAVTLPPS
jgi:hypothetical protein